MYACHTVLLAVPASLRLKESCSDSPAHSHGRQTPFDVGTRQLTADMDMVGSADNTLHIYVSKSGAQQAPAAHLVPQHCRCCCWSCCLQHHPKLQSRSQPEAEGAEHVSCAPTLEMDQQSASYAEGTAS